MESVRLTESSKHILEDARVQFLHKALRKFLKAMVGTRSTIFDVKMDGVGGSRLF